MLKALVIGNGESRKEVDIEKHRLSHTLIGCNAIYRDINVDHLICCDNRMMKESFQHQNTLNCKIYTRDEYFYEHRKIYKRKNIERLPMLPFENNIKADHPRHWGSGPYAIYLATVLGFNDLDMIGFDLYGRQGKINNIYKSTNNYASKESREIDPSFWIYQIGKIIFHNPKIRFTFHNKDSWMIPAQWKADNCFFKSYNNSQLTLNNKSV